MADFNCHQKKSLLPIDMKNDNKHIIIRAYELFNTRDLDAILLLMDPQVNWFKAWEGGYVKGREALRDRWTTMWKEIDPYVTILSMKEREDGRVEVEVEQVVKDLQGNILFDARIIHLYTIVDGLIRSMEVLIPGWGP